MSDTTYILCLLLGAYVLGAAIIILVAFLGTRLVAGWHRRPCFGCGSPMRRRAIADGHVWICGVCGRVRVAGPGE